MEYLLNVLNDLPWALEILTYLGWRLLIVFLVVLGLDYFMN